MLYKNLAHICCAVTLLFLGILALKAQDTIPLWPEEALPNYSVRIDEFGAVLNTDAIKKAIEHVAERGGGHVVIPRVI